MKKIFKEMITLMYMSTLFTSCNQKSKIVSCGLDMVSATSQVSLAFSTERYQSKLSTFKIYIGAIDDFKENWDNDLWGCNPGYGTFAINRMVRDINEQTIKNDYFILDDFPDYEKYPLKSKAIENIGDVVIPIYTGYIFNTFDFDTISLEEGIISYLIVYYDDVNSKEFEENVYLYGIDWGGSLMFEKNDNGITFYTLYEWSEK